MSEKIKLVVRADDAGSSWSSNMGCLEACKNGIARSVEVMMPCAWVSHAATLFNDHPDIDIGIHLTLTSEWDSIKWRPLTAAKSLVDEGGNFFPLLAPRQGDNRQSLAQSNWSFDDILNELRAQMTLGIAMFPRATHISTHMLQHILLFDERVGAAVADMCQEFGLKDDPFGFELPRLEGYPKFPRSVHLRISAFVEQLSELSPGTYIFIDHPAVESAELAATGHTGYEDVQQDRWTCLQTLTSLEVQQQVEHLGIELISYKDL
ncbi:MAG: ChbG/HpnK family deacetylase [Hyphomicrobiales bacterium]